MIKDFEKLCYYQEEPFPSSSIYAQYKVFELAKQQQVKVLLDGQGADEILAGYGHYRHVYLYDELYNLRINNFFKQKKNASFNRKEALVLSELEHLQNFQILVNKKESAAVAVNIFKVLAGVYPSVRFF